MYRVEIDTTDEAATRRHAGQLGLTVENVPAGNCWTALTVTGSRSDLARFLWRHCGGVRSGNEYLDDFAEEITV